MRANGSYACRCSLCGIRLSLNLSLSFAGPGPSAGLAGTCLPARLSGSDSPLLDVRARALGRTVALASSFAFVLAAEPLERLRAVQPCFVRGRSCGSVFRITSYRILFRSDGDGTNRHELVNTILTVRLF